MCVSEHLWYGSNAFALQASSSVPQSGQCLPVYTQDYLKVPFVTWHSYNFRRSLSLSLKQPWCYFWQQPKSHPRWYSPPPLPLCPPASTSYGSCGHGSQPGSWRRPCWLRDRPGGCPWCPPPPGACCNPPAERSQSQRLFTGQHFKKTDLCFPGSRLEDWGGPRTTANFTF